MKAMTLSLTAAALLVAACDKKPPPPPPATTAEATASAAASAAPEEKKPELVAYPPGYEPPEDAGTDAGPTEPKTGICSFHESGYDGQDTRSNEKMIVKVKDDVIVAAEYSYRGSYAIDGKSDQLLIPLVQKKWLDIELPMTSGTKKFQVKIRDDVIELKGTAAQDPEGDCTWEKPEKDEKKKR